MHCSLYMWKHLEKFLNSQISIDWMCPSINRKSIYLKSLINVSLDWSKLVKLKFPEIFEGSFLRFFLNKQLTYKHDSQRMISKLNFIDAIALKINLTYLNSNLNNIITPISVFIKTSFQQPCRKLNAWSSNNMKLLSLIPKLTKHVIQIQNEDHSDTIWWKYARAQWKNNGSTSFAIDNMCYVNFRIWE